MPKIVDYTPPWLLRPSPGSNLFSTQPQLTKVKVDNEESNGDVGIIGPKRTIARRGTEIFVAIGNQIRWADLSLLQNTWDEQEDFKRSQSRSSKPYKQQPTHGGYDEDSLYRVLKVSIHGEIRQLVPSPNGDWLAILTEYTVHIAVLPDSCHLTERDTGPIRLKTYQLGPTVHVTTQSPVVSALWHPLGVDGNAFVTVTADAAVRIWELSKGNHWSFDSPNMAIDLQKLADAISMEDDVAPEGYGKNKGFSADVFDMEVASACFGGAGLPQENGWSSMTLWVGMKTGDVYALCPLLPSKWQPTTTTLATLSAEVVSKNAMVQEDPSSDVMTRRKYDQQYHWLSAIDDEDPLFLPGRTEFSSEVGVYSRPNQSGPVPKLQGPFQINKGAFEYDSDITDIHVIAANLDDELMDNLHSEDEQHELSITTVCLLTVEGTVHICLDLIGVEGEWLPQKKYHSDQPLVPPELPSLTLVESLETLPESHMDESSWPIFTADVQSPYAFFVTHNAGVSYISISDWVAKVEAELDSMDASGAAFRMQMLTEGHKASRQQIIEFDSDSTSTTKTSPAGCIVFHDSGLGYFLLTMTTIRPFAVTLDAPDSQPPLNDDNEDFGKVTEILTSAPRRHPFEPLECLWSDTALTQFLATYVPTHQRSTIHSEIRLSPATLETMTLAHRVLSAETNVIGLAAADLFVRCERLRDEFKEQVRSVGDVSTKVERIVDEDADDYDERPLEGGRRGNEGVERRIRDAKARQTELTERYDRLRRKVARLGRKELSEKELNWMGEIREMEKSLFPPEEREGAEDDYNEEGMEVWRRFETVRGLAAQLVEEAQSAANNQNGTPESASSHFAIPPEIRKANMNKVKSMLERESALVDAATARLERLNLSL
ncbi:MAG: hypothetical protein M1834_002138 [Cirrosporium novae-zelandiae]|nr:MAG: hypothetical protein M1834_002138 [Cirrosporium novae-zelandiae]